jgi:xanthine dehydrogenase accessory factor
MKRDLLDRLLRARSAKRAVALATDLETGEQWLVEAGATSPPAGLGEALLAEVRDALRADRAGLVEIGDRSLFLNVWNPPLRMILVGAVHISQPLARVAALAGFEVFVVDPRRAFAAEMRFPGVSVSTQWPDEGVASLDPDTRCAIVTLTHDPKLDDPALAVALRSDAFYIGCLGSRKTHAKRIERLREAGFSAEEIARIRGPVGLPIGARTPAEIAISILAEVIQQLRQGGRLESRPTRSEPQASEGGPLHGRGP